MPIPILTNAEYLALKKKLHHAHDKIIRIALGDDAAMYEFLSKIVLPHLKGIKLSFENLQVDTTTYIRSNLQVFYSDIVYMTTLIDETTKERESVKVALLVEHKSEMPSQFFYILSGYCTVTQQISD